MKPIERTIGVITVIGIDYSISMIPFLAKYRKFMLIFFTEVVVVNILAFPHEIIKARVLKEIGISKGK
jgi:hypothetical protein